MTKTFQVNSKNVILTLNRLRSDVKQATEKSVREISIRGKQHARKLAPMKTGELRSGIVARQVNKKEARLISSVADTYAYNKWVNQEPGFVTIDPAQITGKYFKQDQKPFKYGSTSAKSPSGNSIIWTGTPKFFDITYQYMYDNFPTILENNIITVINRGG